MTTSPLAFIILAAGKGTRMKSSKPKVLHEIANTPMIRHIIEQAEALDPEQIVTVVAPDMDDVSATVAPHSTAIQHQQNGTGDAVKAAKDTLKDFDGQIIIMIGDTPLITAETLQNLRDAASKTGLSVLGMECDDPSGYGRLITDENNFVTEIVEHKDCEEDQRAITLCNAGHFCADAKLLWDCLDELKSNNAQGEYYLTDIVALAAQKGKKCSLTVTSEEEAMGVNSRAQLAETEFLMQHRLREQALDNGVTMIDPDSVFLSLDTVFGQDVRLEPNIYIGPKVSIGTGSTIYAYSHIVETVIGEHVEIGPFARLRGQARIDNKAAIGNFVEVKKSHFQEGAKAKHLAYLGDAEIGKKTNISAGVITVNYDGFDKHKTTIGAGVMVGCDTTLVAPVSIGDGAYIAAGSTITTNVTADSLAVARNRPIIREGWAASYRKRKQAKKAS
jgi:bifunctional UDP-N-acetylglucosamine pyrophosphorylase/glucosamine-1-phosphate N-acetyltransferase